jgi:dolichyl-phosphate beta-glucosyltransferase
MTRPIALSVVFPAFNEEGRLAQTICETADFLRQRGEPFELITVDDGSRDGTSLLVRTLAATIHELRLIRLPANRGKGYAVRAGVLNATGRLVLFADADGSTPISEVERLEAEIAAGADLAIGSRALSASGVAVRAKFYRRIIGRTFHTLVSWLALKNVLDTQCGFKLFRCDVAQELFSRMRINGFSFDVELLVMASRRGYRIAEVAVNWTHKPGSRVNLVVDSLKMARDLFVIRALAVSGAYDEPRVRVLPDPKETWATASVATAAGAPN